MFCTSYTTAVCFHDLSKVFITTAPVSVTSYTG